MAEIPAWEVVVRLLLATLLGGLVGLERESVNRPAGFRTHILVCVGSALLMITSIQVFQMFAGVTNADPARIAAQVVSGIGFLGAGTILREGANIRGLTTAASLWVIAAIGLAAGAGLYGAAVGVAFISLLTLVVLSRLEAVLISRRSYSVIRITLSDRPGQIGQVGSTLGRYGVNIKNIIMKPGNVAGSIEVELHVRSSVKTDMTEVLEQLMALDGVHSVSRD